MKASNSMMMALAVVLGVTVAGSAMAKGGHKGQKKKKDQAGVEQAQAGDTADWKAEMKKFHKQH